MKQADHITVGKIMSEAAQSGRIRWGIFKKHAHKFGISRRQWWYARLVLRCYALFDWLAALSLKLRPSLYTRWMAYQFGDLRHCVPVPELMAQAPSSLALGR